MFVAAGPSAFGATGEGSVCEQFFDGDDLAAAGRVTSPAQTAHESPALAALFAHQAGLALWALINCGVLARNASRR